MSIFNEEPFLIAEIGVNYYDIAKKENISNMDAAKSMVKEAKDAGCNAVKFQSYKANTIASKNSPAYWDTNEEPTTSQYELFKKFDSFGEREYREIAEYCSEIGIMFLSTPFDFDSIDYLDEFMDVYKISSSDLTNIPFIKKIAEKGKDIIISTGASDLDEIKLAIDTIEKANEKYTAGEAGIGIMHCVLSYPTDKADANLLMIKNLKDLYPDYEETIKIIDKQRKANLCNIFIMDKILFNEYCNWLFSILFVYEDTLNRKWLIDLWIKEKITVGSRFLWCLAERLFNLRIEHKRWEWTKISNKASIIFFKI